MKLILTIIFIVSWCVELEQSKECFSREFESKKEAEHFYKIPLLESKDNNSECKLTKTTIYGK